MSVAHVTVGVPVNVTPRNVFPPPVNNDAPIEVLDVNWFPILTVTPSRTFFRASFPATEGLNEVNCTLTGLVVLLVTNEETVFVTVTPTVLFIVIPPEIPPNTLRKSTVPPVGKVLIAVAPDIPNTPN